ncbi:MAG: dihydrofolate reductase family protein [Chloroflexi bacterium]|nr:dihydrofolate reductase family protein [Chloroflexota bacterium]
MRKLFSFNMMTLDGFLEGSKWDLSWHNVDAEFNEFAIAQLNEIDMLLFGRVTYEGMAGYWSTPDAAKNDPVVAGLMNQIPKIVFSKTLDKADWNNTRLVKDHIADEISKLKQQSGKNLAIFGSANLMSKLMQMNLVDEHRVMVNPVILGAGTPLFQTKNKLNLKLLKTRTFKNGNVLLCYEPNGK